MHPFGFPWIPFGFFPLRSQQFEALWFFFFLDAFFPFGVVTGQEELGGIPVGPGAHTCVF